ncbi:MAG: DNA internalization-related competence protein ComEC/Rec2 [Blautia sp.]|nr:DNA internalization-related competence protein ComEC/Rec2 [Blautia sp.]
MTILMILLQASGIPVITGTSLPEELETWLTGEEQVTISGEVEYCRKTEKSVSIYLNHAYLIYRSKPVSVKNVIVYLKNDTKVPSGTLICVSGKLEKIPVPGNPGQFDYRQYQASRHVYYQMRDAAIEKQSASYSRIRTWIYQLKDRVISYYEENAGTDAGFFEAMVLGSKQNMETEDTLRFQMAGILHLLSISGLHMSLIALGLYNFLKKCRIGTWGAVILTLLVLLPYGIMTGSSVSVLRSMSMVLLLLASKVLGRIYDLQTAMAFSAILILMEAPANLFNAGFLLSFGAVFGISVIAPVLEEIMDVQKMSGFRKCIAKTFVSTAAIQGFMLPVQLYFYGEISISGIFLNLLVIPTAGCVLGSGVAGALIGFLEIVPETIPLKRIFMYPGRILLHIYMWLGELFAQIPFFNWIPGAPKLWQIVFYYVMAALVIIGGVCLRRRGGGRWKSVAVKKITPWILFLGWILGIAVLGIRLKPELRITCMDVGQGDGAVVQTAEGSCILIDGGSSDQKELGRYRLLPFLKNQGIHRIHGIVLSHFDSDHISGILELLYYISRHLTSIRVERIILPDLAGLPETGQELLELAKQCSIPVVYVKQGDTLRIGRQQELHLHVLSPEKKTDVISGAAETANDASLVCQLIYQNFTGLFMGDASMELEETLMPLLSRVDFLKVGHHGSKYSSGEAFLEKIKPMAAVISCSSVNRYGHPHQETLDRLEQTGTSVYRTDRDGAVTLDYRDGALSASGYLHNR